MTSVALLLATFNGARYLREQLDSLRTQTFGDWTLLVRDDGSDDETPDILASYASADDRIRIIKDPLGNLGPVGNFAALLRTARESGWGYCFLVDQDDIWAPEKLGGQLNWLMDAETRLGVATPLLVHSDLRVIDADGQVRSQSFMAYQRIRHLEANPMRVLLVQNFVTGCTVGLNRALMDLALPIPAEAAMHDWWMALLAASAGEILFLADPLVDYRQHQANQVGAVGIMRGLRLYWRRWRRDGTVLNHYRASVRQVFALRERLSARGLFDPNADAHCLVEQYGQLMSGCSSRVGRLVRLRQLGLRRQFWIRQLLLYFQVAQVGPEDFVASRRAGLTGRSAQEAS